MAIFTLCSKCSLNHPFGSVRLNISVVGYKQSLLHSGSWFLWDISGPSTSDCLTKVTQVPGWSSPDPGATVHRLANFTQSRLASLSLSAASMLNRILCWSADLKPTQGFTEWTLAALFSWDAMWAHQPYALHSSTSCLYLVSFLPWVFSMRCVHHVGQVKAWKCTLLKVCF